MIKKTRFNLFHLQRWKRLVVVVVNGQGNQALWNTIGVLEYKLRNLFWQYLSKILHVAPFDQAILFLGIYAMDILA